MPAIEVVEQARRHIRADDDRRACLVQARCYAQQLRQHPEGCVRHRAGVEIAVIAGQAAQDCLEPMDLAEREKKHEQTDLDEAGRVQRLRRYADELCAEGGESRQVGTELGAILAEVAL